MYKTQTRRTAVANLDNDRGVMSNASRGRDKLEYKKWPSGRGERVQNAVLGYSLPQKMRNYVNVMMPPRDRSYLLARLYWILKSPVLGTLFVIYSSLSVGHSLVSGRLDRWR